MFGRIASFKCVLALFLLSSQFSFAAERQADSNENSCFSCLCGTGYTREEARRAIDQAIKDNDKEAFHRASHFLTKSILKDLLGIGLNVCFFKLISSTTLAALEISGEPNSFSINPDNLDPQTYLVGFSTGIMMVGVIPSFVAKAITTARDCYAGAKAIRYSLRVPKEK